MFLRRRISIKHLMHAINITLYTDCVITSSCDDTCLKCVSYYCYGWRVKLNEMMTCIVLRSSTELSSISVDKLYITFSHEIYWSVNFSPVHKSWSGP